MSKFIFVCHREPIDNQTELSRICNNIQPDNINLKKPHIYNDTRGISFGIVNPNETNLIYQGSLCLGYVDSKFWYEIGNRRIDGNFAIVRSNENYVELVSDIVASRTIWYIYNEKYFAASTSQRMLVSYLGNFILNRKVIPWMLSSGNIGYGNSWDLRIKSVPSNSILTLNRETWELNLSVDVPKFESINKSHAEHKQRLEKAIKSNFEKINFDLTNWVLPLSGGYDSRGILFHLENTKNITTVTWGLKESINEVGSDAYVAKELANMFNLKHNYYSTDFSEESVKTIFERFLKIGEGRIDHIAGYLDGFKIWNTLYEEGFLGIIRGDEGFGWVPVKNEKEARIKNGIYNINEIANLKPFTDEIGENNLPNELLIKESESISTWRDRLYHQFRIPVILAALNDLKLTHLELINPLISKEIIYMVRTLPDELRTDKKLFKEIVDSFDIDIPYAKYSSTMETKFTFKQKEVVEELKSELKSFNLLPASLIEYILANITSVKLNKKNNMREKIIRNVKSILPNSMKNFLRKNIKTNIDINTLAFRAYIIEKMNKILIEDAKVLKK